MKYMGWASEMQIREQERGYGYSNKKLCCNCVGDYYLKQYIEDNGEDSTCDYCGCDEICIDLDEIMEPIMKGIREQYDDAANCLGYNGREGGYLGTTYDSYDLIHEELEGDFEFSYYNIYDDISNLVDDSIIWCQRDPYGELPYEEDYYTWKKYSNILKKYGKEAVFKNEEDNSSVYSRADKILERIGEGIKKLKLIENIDIGTNIYRTRAHEQSEIVNSAKSLGSPKKEIAACNRMNFKGVSTFYGAFDKNTALKEIQSQKRKKRTVGIFNNLVKLNIIDLNKIDKLLIPSLFDVDENDKRMLLIFLKKFNEEISKPITNEKEKEYLPTQKMVQYLREKMTTEEGSKIDGIIYSSAQNNGGKCCDLFVSSEQCSDGNDGILKLDFNSLNTY